MRRQRPLVDSPRDLEEGFDWMHLSQRGVSIGQLDGCDAQGPHVTAGVVRVVVLLLTGDDLTAGRQPSKKKRKNRKKLNTDVLI